MLRGFGIDELDEAVYVEILRRRQATAAELVDVLGIDPAIVGDCLAKLATHGLVTGHADGLHTAVAPDVGLGTLIVQRQAELQQVQSRLTELVAVYRTGSSWLSGQVEAITTPEQLASWLDSMERGAQREALAFFRPPYILNPDLETITRFAPTYRYVYERSAFDDPRAPEEISGYLKNGYEIRIADSLPSKLIIIDRQAVVLPMRSDQVSMHPGFLLVRGESLVRSLVDLFERVWATATPLRVTAAGDLANDVPAMDEVDVHLLTLLLSGLPDKTVASRLGTSERTVQRRLRRLMALTGASSRMQLGWYAARSGLIPL
ncbi:LuxR family transcriptional regulator [Micromonospora polyrhachis]|uniref:Putative transcriptional regulator n=1 Tax=Micromonospora polyrhachis TaxID=1282883 RepID=A0A7W7SXC8_9ACTN|nr:helix-turn-helix domain-containing protein [Micromonospora polyrhachis]MBB4962624.1 putative transcriptional regulator [Micromonospora polyrhachis]